MMFHRHQWVEVKRYFVPPMEVAWHVKRGSPETIRQLAQGVTVVELRCEKCGAIRSDTLPGDAR